MGSLNVTRSQWGRRAREGVGVGAGGLGGRGRGGGRGEVKGGGGEGEVDRCSGPFCRVGLTTTCAVSDWSFSPADVVARHGRLKVDFSFASLFPFTLPLVWYPCPDQWRSTFKVSSFN